VLHHSFGRFLRAPRIVIRVVEDRVVAELARPCLETLDNLRKERIFNIGDDDAQRAAFT